MNMTARAPSPWHGWRRQLHMETVQMLRTPAFSWPTLLFPVLFYALFVLGMRSMGAAAYLLSTYVIFASMAPGLFGMGLFLANERAHGWHDLQRAAPVAMPLVLAAKLVISISFALASMLLIMLMAALVGGVELSIGTWLLLVALALPAGLLSALIGTGIGLLASPPVAMALVNVLFVPLAVLSGLWFPLSMMAPLLQSLGVLLPFYHLAQLALMATGQVVVGNVGLHVGVSLAWFALGILWAALAWRIRQR